MKLRVGNSGEQNRTEQVNDQLMWLWFPFLSKKWQDDAKTVHRKRSGSISAGTKETYSVLRQQSL